MMESVCHVASRTHAHFQRRARVRGTRDLLVRGCHLGPTGTNPSSPPACFLFQTAAVRDPTSLRNAKNAILEELPRIVNTVALLWNVLRKEETQKRPVDLLGAMRGSSSVYFKTTKVRGLPPGVVTGPNKNRDTWGCVRK